MVMVKELSHYKMTKKIEFSSLPNWPGWDYIEENGIIR